MHPLDSPATCGHVAARPYSHSYLYVPWISSTLLLASTLASAGCFNDSIASSVDAKNANGDAIFTASNGVLKPRTMTDLMPVIRPVGDSGELPAYISIQLAQPVFGGTWYRGERREASDRTNVRIEPAVDGAWVFTSPSTLVFEPSKGFSHNTKYTISISSIEVDEGGQITPAKGDAYSHVFTTAAFAFKDMRLAGINEAEKQASLDLIFTGPVQLGSVEKKAFFRLDGAAAQLVSLTTTERPNVLRAVISFYKNAFDDATISMTLNSGAKSDLSSTALGEISSSVRLPRGKNARILGVYPEEGSSGFYLRVVCSDTASGAEDQYYWDETSSNSYDSISSRCVLDDRFLSNIKIEPAVKVSVVPAPHGFRLLGNFSRGTYSISLPNGMQTVDTGIFKSNFERTIDVPARSPQARFVSQGRYLPRNAWKNLAIQHINVGEATLTMRQVSTQNLVFWMSDDNTEAANERNSDLIVEKKIAITSKPDTMTTTWVDVASLLPASTTGLLELQISSASSNDKRRIMLTNMNLVAKKSNGDGRVWTWVTNIDDNSSMSGVEIKQVTKSGRVISRCTTDGQGFCLLNGASNSDVDKSPPFALIASKGSDLTYLKYSELEAHIAESAIGGVNPAEGAQKESYRAAIYPDRGVYRPGEVVHLAAIVRGQNGAAPTSGMPVELEIRDPLGKPVRRAALKVNAAGALQSDFNIGSYAATGTYRAELTAGKQNIGSLSFLVEEFVPERMKVDVTANKNGLLMSEEASFNIAARYLFGGSAADSPVQMTCTLSPSMFSPAENGEYAYGPRPLSGNPDAKIPSSIALGQIDNAIGANGVSTLACPSLTERGMFRTSATLTAQAAVLEAGSGRTSQNAASVAVHPEKYYLGLKSRQTVIKRGDDVNIEGVVVDWNGKINSSAVKSVDLAFYRLEVEYRWGWNDDTGQWSDLRTEHAILEERTTANVQNGKFTATFKNGADASTYVVKVRSGNAETDFAIDGEGDDGWYWWGDGYGRADVTPKPGSAATIPLRLAGETSDVKEAQRNGTSAKLRVGQETTVTFVAPFAGRALLTVESDRVLSSEWRNVKAGANEWKIKVDSFVPNIYVSAFVVKDPHAESKSAFMPDRALGVRSFQVDPSDFTQAIKLDAPKEIRSQQSFNVTVDVGANTAKSDGPTYVTVAAVDVGVLQLTKFAAPDPLATIFAKRALGITTYETVGWNVAMPAANTGKATGGSEGDGMGRVQPVKIVALWSGLVEVPANGKITIPFSVPSYRGQLRIMAVSASPKRIGRAETEVTVRDPIVLQATLPRFLVKDDEMKIPVFVTNVSGKDQEIDVKLTAEPLAVPGMSSDVKAATTSGAPVTIAGNGKSLRLRNGDSNKVMFDVKAMQAVGAAHFRVEAKAGTLVSTEELDVPFAPATPREREIKVVELKQGNNDLKPYLQGFLPTTDKTSIWVTTNPYGDVFNHLTYLLHYPYGCIEQTTSSARPLLYLGSLVSQVDPSVLADGGVDKMVMAGIERILSMQTPSGGFGYWPGAREAVQWGTAYATHFLMDAAKRGYSVPQDRIDDAVRYLENELNALERGARGQNYYYGDAEPYAHYVLALAGKGRKARIQQQIEERSKFADSEASEQVYMLKAALYLSGDQRYERDLKNPDVGSLTSVRRNDWSFYSDRRRRGLTLSIFGDLFGRDPAGEKLAQLVASGLRGHASGWYTTQELVWGITGLGKRLEPASSDFSIPVLTAGGKEMAAALQEKPTDEMIKKNIKPSHERTWSLYRASEYSALNVRIDSKDSGKLYAIINVEGIKQNANYKTGGGGLRVDRQFVNAEGKPVSLADGIKVGDVVYTIVTVQNTSPERQQNLALVDRLPAGFEIENPHLGRNSTIAVVSEEDQWAIDSMNMRDDRVEYFGGLASGETRKVVYAVRAVTGGRFTVPPVEAEAMYDGNLWARQVSSSKLVVQGP